MAKTYLLDKEKEEARRRLALLARIEDPGSIACLERIGVRAGWRCLEVGAGTGTHSFVRAAGLDPGFGGRLFGALRRLGFSELHAEGRAHVFRGRPDQAVSAHVAAFTELKEQIVGRGHVTPSEFDDFLALTRNPDFAWREGLTMAAWGRKSAATPRP